MEIVTLSQLNDDKLKELVGKRIILGGKGLIDGLKHMSKSSADRVTDIVERTEYGRCIQVKEYGRKLYSILPEWNWNQECAILSEKEYKELPKW